LLITFFALSVQAFAQGQPVQYKSAQSGADRQRQLEESQQQQSLLTSLLQRFFNTDSSVTSFPSSPFDRYTSSSGQSSNGSFLNSNSGACGSVKVDCATHKISIIPVNINPRAAVIDCGRMGLTKNGIGMVGGLHSGSVVKDGVNIQIPGMGESGGGKVFHTCFWRQDPRPTGQNSSAGCVHTSPAVLAKLKTCKGSPLEIVNAEGGGANPNASGSRLFQQSYDNNRSGVSQ
jgi:hypothetical protein